MATRRIDQDEIFLNFTNYSANKIAIGNVLVSPGQTVKTPARYVSGNISEVSAIASLVSKGHLGVSLTFAAGGLSGVPLDKSTILSMTANTSGVLGMPPVFANANRPANANVPVGFQLYDSTNNLPNYNDGTQYVDGTGAVAP